jgi:putative transposase
MESFFGTLKEECVGKIVYSSHDEARLELFTYIETYYNRIRRHSTLGYMSPLHYEQMGDLPNVTLLLTIISTCYVM